MQHEHLFSRKKLTEANRGGQRPNRGRQDTESDIYLQRYSILHPRNDIQNIYLDATRNRQDSDCYRYTAYVDILYPSNNITEANQRTPEQ